MRIIMCVDMGYKIKEAVERLIILAMVILSTLGCDQSKPIGNVTPKVLSIPSLRLDSLYQVFVETPAGSSTTLSYNHHDNRFDTLTLPLGGLKHDYLPYPLNACFFPLWIQDSLVKVPAWLLSTSVPAGGSIRINILGIIEYKESGVSKKELLVLPNDAQYQTIQVDRFRDFIILYDPVKFIFETWLKNRHGIGLVSQMNWQDEEKAREYLESIINQMAL
ncbi:MAG: hypothetical protein IPL46_12765 [Saprospiraceae bacterium]|nr:hypothetical protein [Saprospiraceae bacterium]